MTMADFYVNQQGVASPSMAAIDPELARRVAANRAGIAADTAARVSAIEGTPINGFNTAPVESAPTAKPSLTSRVASGATNMGKGTVKAGGALAGGMQAVQGATGIADALANGKPVSGGDMIRSGVGAASFMPVVAPAARAVAGGMSIAQMVPDKAYEWGMDKMGLMPKQGVQVNPNAFGGKTPEQVIAAHSKPNVATPVAAPAMVQAAPVQGELMPAAQPAPGSVPGTGVITNNQTGQTTQIGAQPQPQQRAQPQAQRPGASDPMVMPSMAMTPAVPKTTAPVMPVLQNGKGIMGAMVNFANQAGNTANQISANNTANGTFKQGIMGARQDNDNAKTNADIAQTRANIRQMGKKGQADDIDLAQKQRVNALQGEYMNATPERQKQIAKEISLYTGKDPSAQNLERVRSTTNDANGNPVGIDYLYDKDSKQWIAPPSGGQPQQQQQQFTPGGVYTDGQGRQAQFDGNKFVPVK